MFGRPVKKINVVLFGLIVATPFMTVLADSQTFEAARSMGQSHVQGGIPQSTNLNGQSVLPNSSVYQDSQTTNELKSYYKEGRNGQSSITNLMQKGQQVKSESSHCADDDAACKARNTTIKNYDGIGNPYNGSAKALAANIPEDPLAALGMNVPDANGGSVCVETTATTDPTTEQKTCLQTQYRSLNVLSKLPTSTHFSYTQPLCIDPDYSISGDLSTCSKTVYSCPNGGTLDGVNCVKTETVTAPTNTFRCRPEDAGKSFSWSLEDIKCLSSGELYYKSKGSWFMFETTGLPTFHSRNGYCYWGGSGFPVCKTSKTEPVPSTYLLGGNFNNSTGAAFFIDKDFLFSTSPTEIILSWQNRYHTGIWLEPAVETKTTTTSYPATSNTYEAQPGCLGAPIPSGSTDGGTALVDGDQSGGTKTCQTTYYSCPTGMSMNGQMCEDPDRPNYAEEPRCVNLGYDPNAEEEVFYCDEAGLDECAEMPDGCVETDATCVYRDEVANSPTQGECLAWEKQYECPVPGRTVTTQSCGFNPLCFNGNCFTPKTNQCTGVFKTITKPTSKQCFESVPQTIQSCGIDIYQEWVDGSLVQKARPSADCDTYQNDTSCKQIAIRKDADDNWPSNVYYSCLGEPVSHCNAVINDPTCKDPVKTCIQYENLSGQTGSGLATSTSGRCLEYQVDYACTETYSEPGDQCTEDMAKTLTAMEVSRQSGTYIDPDNIRIFGGDFARCDRRTAAWGGGGFGSKSCCNISAPDPQTDHDFVKEQLGYSDVSVFVEDVQSVSNVTYDIMTGKLDDLSAIQAASAAANLYTAYNAISSLLGTQTFSPWGIAIKAVLATYMNYQAALACDDMDYQTATNNKARLCYNTRSYCAQENCGLFGCVCEKFRTSQCCYNSKLARIINEQGKRQLGISAAQDTCDGFTVAQIEALDWSKIDLTEFVNELITDAQKRMPTASEIQQGINNNKVEYANSNGQLAKPDRLNYPTN